MAKTASSMLALGTNAPDFTLPDTVSGTPFNLYSQSSNSKAVLVSFICNHCPFVIHVLDELIKLSKDYENSGLLHAAISSNNVDTHPQDSPELMKQLALEKEFSFPYLYDETQEVAKSYEATCTPDFFLFDSQMSLVYRGQLDDSRPGTGKPVTGADLRAAIENIFSGATVSSNQKPSIGCNIKWR